MKRLIILVLGLLFLAGCGAFPMPPDQAVNEYWKLHKEGKVEEAYRLIVEGREDEAKISLVAEDEKLSVRLFLLLLEQKLEITTEGFKKEGDKATVNIIITKPNYEEALLKINASESMREIIENVSDINHEGKAVLHLVDGEWKVYGWELDILDERINDLRDNFIDETLIKVEANPEKGFFWPYYLSVPARFIVKDKTSYLLVCPNNTGTGHDNYQVHLDAAHREVVQSGWSYQISRGLDVPLLVPAFPRPYAQWWYYVQALNRGTMQIKSGPLERIDLQLIAMIKDAQERLNDMGFSMEEKVLMNGYSASGWFTIRFTVIHPHIVRAAAIGGNFTQILPIEELGGEKLQYPVGVADLEQLTGKAFNYDEYIKVAQYIYLGELDPNDATYFEDGFERRHGEQIRRLIGKDTMARWEKTQEIYKEAGIPAQFKTYKGIGHRINYEITSDVISFFVNIED